MAGQRDSLLRALARHTMPTSDLDWPISLVRTPETRVLPVVLSSRSSVSAGVLLYLPRIVTDRAVLHRAGRKASASAAEGIALRANTG